MELASVSSAALGGLCLERWYNKLNCLLGAHFTPWASVVNMQVVFASVYGQIDKKFRSADLDFIASNQVHGLIDGMYTDNTGIGNAIASGADSLTVFMHGAIDLIRLFQGGERMQHEAGMEILFFPIFEETIGFAKSQLAQFTYLELPIHERHFRFMHNLSVGIIQATTKANDWFGINSGQKVTLQVINIHSPLGIGFFADFSNYNTLVAEIIACLTFDQNLAAVQHLVLPIMLQG